MAKLNWGTIGERFFEAGVDRGVLYPNNSSGLVWNGLKAVKENPSGGAPTPYYIDGLKYLNLATAEEFEATLEAFSAPAAFGRCDGTFSVANGLFATQQPRESFGFSYRTKLGNDISGVDHGYKIHLVYNALAAPASRDYKTLGRNTEALPLSWNITTTPPALNLFKPTAHMVVESDKTDPILLSVLEGFLYGALSLDPRLLTPTDLVDLFTNWSFPSLTTPFTFYGISQDSLTLPETASQGDAYIVDGELWVSDIGVWTNMGPVPESIT